MAAPTSPRAPMGGASTSDVLTAIQNIVKALATESQNYLNVEGISNVAAISTPTVVKGSPGRVAAVSVIVAGSASGMIYDSITVNSTTKPLWVIPMGTKTSGEPYTVNLPAIYGIVVSPGTGQTLTVSYS